MTQSTLDLVLRATKKGTGVSEASKELGALDDQAKATGGTLSNVGRIAGGMLKAGILAAAGAAVDSVKETMEYNKAIRDLAQNLSITTEETSRIIQTADDFTVSQQDVTAALQMAVKNGMAPNIATLAKMADEYNNITDPTERAARLTEVFGKNWTALTPMLKEGGQAIRDAAAAQDKALLVTEENSKATRELEKNLDNLGDKVTALKLNVGNALIPVLNQAADAFTALSTGISETGDATEMQLTQAIAQAVLAFGAESTQVQQLSAALQNYLITRQQVGMTEQEHATRIAMAEIRALDDMAVATQRLESSTASNALIQSSIADALAKKVSAEQADAAALNAAAEADAIYRAGVSETVTKIETLAQSLVKATDAQAKQALAQASLDGLKTAYDNGTLSQEGFQRATDAVLLRYDLATPKSLAMAEAQQKITDAFVAGNMPLNDYITASEKIPTIAADGTVTLQELAELGVKPTTDAVHDQAREVGALKGMWDKIPRNVTTVYTIETKGSAPTGGSPSGRAGGGPVAQGVPVNVNELFNERFVPYAAGSMMPSSGNTSYQTTIASGAVVINPPAGVNAREIAQAVMAELGRQTNQLIAAGAGGMGV